MKKATRRVAERDTMREEYDFRGGVRGKYAARLPTRPNVVSLDPDVAEVFPDSAAVNDALRALARVARRTVRPRRRRRAT
jgi:hypothetical protein